MRSAFVLIALLAVLVAFDRQSARADADVDQGRRYYLQYCASCHGSNGDGQGPVAKVLSTKPTDLRLLGERYGIPLPTDRLAKLIDGREVVAAHGSREMPVWGEKFEEVPEKGREAKINERIRKILAYLETIQRIKVANPGSPESNP
ncbi:MAG TPA: cytochrome c [Candidatus Binataceae bacterium]